MSYYIPSPADEQRVEAVREAAAIMQKFIDKVNTGRAKSTETYGEMKNWLFKHKDVLGGN